MVGFCFAGLFTTIESWINSGVANENRARALAFYRIIDLASVTVSQFLIPLFGPEGFLIFGGHGDHDYAVAGAGVRLPTAPTRRRRPRCRSI